MSQAAYALAVRDAIQAVMPSPWGDSNSVEVGLDGQPKPSCGEWYVAIHPGEWSADNGDFDLNEYVSLNVTITRRLGYSPQDRWGPEVWTKSGGLDALARSLIPVVHYNYATMAAANTNITTGDDKFCEPLQFQGAGPPQLKGPEWFSSDSEDMAATGLILEMRFGKARRMQRADIEG